MNVKRGLVTHSTSEWLTGWPVLVMGFLGVFWMHATAGSLVVLVKPIAQEWGWSRGETTLFLSINALIILFVGPIAGAGVRRFGPYRMALVSVPLAALALVLIGQTGPSLLLWYGGWLLFSVVYFGNNMIVWASAVTSAFDKNRGLALAIILSGNAVAHSIMPVLTLQLYERYGIDGAYAGLGCLLLVTCLPFLLFRYIRERGNEPTGDNKVSVDAAKPDWSLTSVLFRARFWQLAFGFMTIGAVVGSIAIHFLAMMSDQGIPTSKAAWIFSLLGPAILVGRFGGAFLLDHCSARQVIVPIFSAPVLACLLVVNFDGSPQLAVIIVLLTGLAAGAEGDLLAYFAGRYFGKENFAQIYAVLFGLFAVVYSSAPAMVGFVYDRIGAYGSVFTVLGALLVVGTLTMLLLGDYPEDKNNDEVPAG